MLFLLVFGIFFTLGMLMHHSLIRSFNYLFLLIIPWGGVVSEYITLASIHPVLGFVFGHFVYEKRYLLYTNKTVLIRFFLLTLFIAIATLLTNINYHIFARELIHAFFFIIVLAFIFSKDHSQYVIKPLGILLLIIFYYLKILIYFFFVHESIAPVAGQFIKQAHLSYSDFSMWIIIMLILNAERPYSNLPFVIFAPAIMIAGTDTLVFLYVILGIFLIFGNFSKILIFLFIAVFAVIGIFIIADNLAYFGAIMASRNYPLILLLKDGLSVPLLLGTGFGVGIEIPWFNAVPGLENKALFYDNMYGTTFIKFGVVGSLLLAVFLLKVKERSSYVFVVLVIAGMAGSVLYQNSFMFALYLTATLLKRSGNKLI